MLVKFRNFLYDKGLIKSYKLPIPVVSVGNLSVGGSGKSSLVTFLAEHFQDQLHVCILSRGYKRKTRGTLLVSYRGDIKCNWHQSGDEPYMIATLLKRSSVVVDEDRYRGGKFAFEKLGAQMLILDDGFQHRRLARDVDILLLKFKDLRDRLLPFGRLREPLSSLKRAHALVLSYQDIKEWELNSPIPTFKMWRTNWSVKDAFGNRVDTKDRDFIAFAGLGDNEQFFQILNILGIRVKKRISLPDHYNYEAFTILPQENYITTLKDFVKLPKLSNLFYLDFDIKVDGLIEFVRNKLQEKYWHNCHFNGHLFH